MVQYDKKDLVTLQSAQTHYLRFVLEVPKSTPLAALYLELGILPIQYEIERRQLLFLKRLLGKKDNDPVMQSYQHMCRYPYEKNWANYIVALRNKYNLPLNDQNIINMSKYQWKTFLMGRLKSYVFESLTVQCELNSKTKHLMYKKFGQAAYLTKLDPQIARNIFRARTRMYDVKVNFKRKYANTLCPFCRCCDENFDHILHCSDGLLSPSEIRNIKLCDVGDFKSNKILTLIGKYLIKYQKYRELVI